MKPATPPHTENHEGRPRRIGVEIEFGDMDVSRAAGIVAELYGGGGVREISAYHRTVSGTRHGDFEIVLDSRYVLPEEPDKLNLSSPAREKLGDAASSFVPTEIACPPIDWNRLDELTPLLDALRKNGATGTAKSVAYAFALHVNPDVPSTDAESLTRHLRAYLLLAPWLRDQIGVDITRRFLPFANPFPDEFVAKVVHPDYAPTLDELIADYAGYNPTRNRELDMYPLFAWLRPELAGELYPGQLVKPRPTFHYRLPNTQLSQPDWGAITEWNRWVEIERLAVDPGRLHILAGDYLEHASSSRLDRWVKKLRDWIGAA